MLLASVDSTGGHIGPSIRHIEDEGLLSKRLGLLQ